LILVHFDIFKQRPKIARVKIGFGRSNAKVVGSALQPLLRKEAMEKLCRDSTRFWTNLCRVPGEVVKLVMRFGANLWV